MFRKGVESIFQTGNERLAFNESFNEYESI